MRKLRHIHIKIVFLNHLYHTKTPLPHMGKVTQSIDWIKINLSLVHYVPTQNSFEYGHIWFFVSYGFNKIKSSHKKMILMQSTFILVALEWISFCILFSAIKFIMKFFHPRYWLQFVTTFFYLIVITQIWSNEVLPKKCFFENSLVSALSTIARLWEI